LPCRAAAALGIDIAGSTLRAEDISKSILERAAPSSRFNINRRAASGMHVFRRARPPRAIVARDIVDLLSATDRSVSPSCR
jgi:hypothetical protein